MKDSRRPDHVSLASMVGRSREGGAARIIADDGYVPVRGQINSITGLGPASGPRPGRSRSESGRAFWISSALNSRPTRLRG